MENSLFLAPFLLIIFSLKRVNCQESVYQVQKYKVFALYEEF